jgi:hypothetical protein
MLKDGKRSFVLVVDHFRIADSSFGRDPAVLANGLLIYWQKT